MSEPTLNVWIARIDGLRNGHHDVAPDALLARGAWQMWLDALDPIENARAAVELWRQTGTDLWRDAAGAKEEI